MMNSAACRLKTARAPAGSPYHGKPSSDKRLMQGSGVRYRRAYETSRKVGERREVEISVPRRLNLGAGSISAWSGSITSKDPIRYVSR